MDRSRQILSAIDELRQIRSDIRLGGSLDMVRRSFERLQEIRREHLDDFDLQIIIADAQQEIIERARILRGGLEAPIITAPPPPREREVPLPIDPEAERAEIPAEVPKLDRKSWQLAVGLAALFTVGICASFFYLIQTARRLNFTAGQPAVTGPQQPVKQDPASPKTSPVANVTPAVAFTPTLRLYTDLAAGTVTIDDQPAKDLVDGELNLDSLTPGTHSVRVEGKSGSASFNFALADDKDVPRVTEILKTNNAMMVLVSVKNGTGRLSSDAAGATVNIDAKPAGAITPPDGLLLSDLGNQDHDLEILRARDRQKFVLTYTPAPTMTVFVKSDPSTGVLTVSTGQDGVAIFINDLPYRRVTEHGEMRIPLKVGSYRIRVHKPGFQDPAVSLVEVKKSAEASVQFHMQPVLEFSTLQIRGAQVATVISVDHQVAATVGLDGTAKVVNVRPGEHLIELHHDQAINRQLTRTFEVGQTVTLSGADVALDRLAADNKSVIPGNPGSPAIAPPETPQLDTALNASGAEKVHRGGGFVPYQTPKSPGNFYFQAHAKLGGILKKAKLQWFAGYQDQSNYVLFSLDGKHADVKEVRDGKQMEVGRVSFPVASDEWVQIEVSVRADTLQARAKTGSGSWMDLIPVNTTGRDFTKNSVGLYIPSNDEVAVANFHFSGR